MTIFELCLILLMGLSTLWVFDGLVYSVAKAPHSATYGRLYWKLGAIILAIGIGYFTLGGFAFLETSEVFVP